MKKMIKTVAVLSLVLASMSFVSAKETTVLGVKYTVIEKCADLETLRTKVNDGKGYNVILEKDINCVDNGNKQKLFSSIGKSESRPFLHVFDGNGKTISGLNIGEAGSEYAGFFAVIGKGATVKNFTLANSSVNSSNTRVGAIAGVNYGTIDSVIVAENVIVEGGTLTGGLVGNNGRYGTITNSVNKASVMSGAFGGGIAGVSTNVVTNSVNYGSISAHYAAGGILGWNAYRQQNDSTFTPGQVISCENNGSVVVASNDLEAEEIEPFTYDYWYAGGIVGYNQDGSIDNCRNNGSVESLVEKYEEECIEWGIFRCLESRKKSLLTSYVGGIVGGSVFDGYSKYWDAKYYTSVTNSINTSSNVAAISPSKAAGVVGVVDVKGSKNNAERSVVQNCYYDQDVFKGASAITKVGKGTITDVDGMETSAMKTQNLTDVLNTMNGKRENAFAWYFETGDYPRLSMGTNHGVFHIVFKVDGDVYFETMTDKGVVENAVASPTTGNNRSFNGWLDEYNVLYSTDGANKRTYGKNVEYNASFDKLFAIKFVTSYGKELSTAYFKAGAVPFYSETNIPADDTTAAVIYKFQKWDREFVAVTKEETYTAIYDEDPVLVDITFVNYNDTVLKVVPTAVGSVPVFSENDEVPSREGNAQFTYEFTGWTPELVAATEAAKYTAVYKEIVNTFDVKFFVLGGQKGETQKVAYGMKATAPAIDSVPGYRFDGWDKAFDNVVTDLDVKALMTPMVVVCFNAPDYNVENCKEYKKDSTYEVPALPSMEGEEGFACTDWTLDGSKFEASEFKPSEKMEFIAECHDNYFDVKFFVLGEQKGETQKVAYGMKATAPAFDSVPSYRFDGWDKAFDNVVADLDVNANMTKMEDFCIIALGEKNCKSVPVDSLLELPDTPSNEDSTCYEWQDEDGVTFDMAQFYVTDASVLKAKCTADFLMVRFFVDGNIVDENKVARGHDAVAPEVSDKKGFRFDHWDADFTNVQENLDVNAVFVETVEYCIIAAGIDTCKTVDKGSENDTPDLPKSEDEAGVTCTDWLVGGEIYNENTFIADSAITFVGVCHNNAFEVKFFAFEALVDSQKVAYGAAAIAPDSLLSDYEGFRFKSWDKAFDNVIEDLTVNAVFDTMVKVSVLDTSFYVPKDTVIKGIKEKLDSLSAFVCEDIMVNGEALDADTILVDKDIAVTANCHAEKYTVSYYAKDSLLGTEKVFHNLSAKANVNIPEIAGKRFVGWDVAEKLKHVIEDLKANAVYEDVDSVFVIANGKAIDTLVIVKGDSVNYVLPNLENTADSTFNGWKFNDKNVSAGDTVVVKGGMTIVADFSRTVGITGNYVVGFSVISENGKLQVVGAKLGDVMTVFDLQGRVVLNKQIQSVVETVEISRSGGFLVRVGYQTRKITIK